MKKLIYCALALAAGLFAASCQQENLEPAAGEHTVTYTVEAPMDVQTKAIADGLNVNELIYEVWWTSADGTRDLDGAQRLYQGKTVMVPIDGVNKGTVTLNLVEDQHYTILFWAQVEGTGVYNTTHLVNVHYNNLEPKAYYANDDALAAFYAVDFVNDGIAKNSKVYLKRPFAQVNLATLNERDPQNNPTDYNITLVNSKMTLDKVPTQFNVATSEVDGDAVIEFEYNGVPSGEDKMITVNDTEYYYTGMNYVFAGSNLDLTYQIQTSLNGSENLAEITNTIVNVPVKENYRTNIVGNLLTSKTDYEIIVDANFNDKDLDGGKIGFIDGQKYVKIENEQEFNEAFADENVGIIILSKDVVLTETLTRTSTDYTLTIASGKTLTIDLNGKKLSSTSTQTGGNYNMFDVRGTLTVKNGTMEYEHVGENMGWGASTNLFNVTAGGVLNLEGVTAKNLGGSDMGFVAHLNNWGEVTLNVDNCTLESNYVAVRVFNSGNDMNNVTIKNSTLKGGSAAFWVHNYTVEDFGSEAKAEAQKALLNLNIYNQGNTFSPDVNGIRYGFTNSIRTDAYGITKTVSEDGTEVTLGSLVENGLIRRGVAGAEENTTITKVVVEEGVATLYDRTFRRFYALETVELPSTLTTIGAAGSGVFQSCTALKNIVIPESVTVLGKGTFQECSSLESINIPAGVTRIESDCLRATGLKSVEFHAGVTYFGAQAFRDCKQLTEVIINAPEFTMESNTFGVMAAPYPTMTIYVANAEMKAYVESNLTAHAKTYITVVAPEVVSTTTDLQAAASEGKNVVLADDLTVTSSEMVGAPYGNKTAVVHNGGVFDGNGKTLNMTIGGDNYVIMTNGGTIKNVTIDKGFRGVVVMSANQTVKLENVVCSGDVCYALNTAEGDSTQDLVATNCTFDGWSSWSLLKSATFTNCSFGQGEYYTNVTGRLGKPYVNTLFDGCEFCSKFYIDLSALGAEQKVTLKNCTVNGVKLTTENWSSLVAPEDTCGEGQISIELKNGTYMTADNVADYVVFE